MISGAQQTAQAETSTPPVANVFQVERGFPFMIHASRVQVATFMATTGAQAHNGI